MGKSKHFSSKKKRGLVKSKQKHKKMLEKYEVVNKKAIFNRYKNKQKIEEELEKKKRFEYDIKSKQQVTYSESEEEEDPYEQLVSCFSQNAPKANETDSESDDMEQSNGDLDEADEELENESVSEHASDIDMSDSELEETKDIEEQEQSESDADVREESENDIDDGDENGEDDDEADPFIKHLQYDLSDELLVSLSNTSPNLETTSKTWKTLGNFTISIPKPITAVTKKLKQKVTILEEKHTAPLGTIPNLITNVDLNKLYIKSQIREHLVSANKKNLVKKDLELSTIFTPVQKELFSIINNYQDLYYPERTFINADEIRFTYCLHVVNHMLKTRTKILHHNAKLAKKKDDPTEEYRDQGLVRPKVIIVVPFKDAAYRVVKTIIDILVPKEAGQVINKNRFESDFTGNELLMPQKNPKPEDYELLFSGNTDDTFRLGMTLTKKSLKLYTDFYSSDVIVASPLGLRMIVGAEGEEERDHDFLASVEVLVMDQADVFLMQNWDHVLHVLDHFHLQPRKTHNTDFSRVRYWAVNGWSKYYRQTLLFSSVALPELRALFNRKCQNYAGKVIVSNTVEVGTIRQVVLQVPQVFHRFNATSPLSAPDARFEYFVKELLPKLRDPLMSHTLLFVPSYFDYVRLRNHFKKEDISFVQICEYSKEGKIARARDMFFHTEAHFMLYSERVHFFRRLRIKGVRHLVFYQPPTYPQFYSEMCNLMQEYNQNKYGGSECNMSISALYCRYDAPTLAAVLGASRASTLLRADTSTHMYVTGE